MKPYIIKLTEAIGKGGKLSFLEHPSLPFGVQRVYWTYDVKQQAQRGGHSHLNSDRIIVCMKGKVNIELENRSGQKFNFELDKPNEVLYFPRQYWIIMSCSVDSILLTLASCKFEDDIYQKDYELFKGEQ